MILKKAFFTSLISPMRAEGFSLDAVKDTFRREDAEVVDMFQLVCLDGKPGLRIQPNVAVRVHCVEDIFHQTSGFEKKFQKDTPTIGAPLETSSAKKIGILSTC